MNEYPPLVAHMDKSRVDWLKYCDWGRFIPILYVSTTGGLCNRILGLASCVTKASLEKRRLVSYWPLNDSDGTSVQWEDLFLDKLDFFNEWDLYWMMDVMHQVKWYDNIEDTYSQVDTANIVLTKASHDYFAASEKGHKAFDHSLAIQWLKSLRVQPSILSQVESFGLRQNTLGVHLRVGESQFSDGLFAHDPITNDLCERIKRWPGNVLVVSNSSEYKHRLWSMFPNKVVFQRDIRHDRSSPGTQSALVDLLLLSRCSEKVGNTMSTFFKLANYWSV